MTSFGNLGGDFNDRVRELAYLMWESAGRQQGMAVEYWLAAEKAILDMMQTTADAWLSGAKPDGAAAVAAAPAAKEAAPPAEPAPVAPPAAQPAAPPAPAATASPPAKAASVAPEPKLARRSPKAKKA